MQCRRTLTNFGIYFYFFVRCLCLESTPQSFLPEAQVLKHGNILDNISIALFLKRKISMIGLSCCDRFMTI